MPLELEPFEGPRLSRDDKPEKVDHHFQVQNHGGFFLEVVGLLFVFQATEQVAQESDENVQQNDGHHDRPENHRESGVVEFQEIVAFNSAEEGPHVRIPHVQNRFSLRVQLQNQNSGRHEKVDQNQKENDQFLDNCVDHADQSCEGVDDAQVREGPVEHHDQPHTAQHFVDVALHRLFVVEQEVADQNAEADPVDVVPRVFEVSGLTRAGYLFTLKAEYEMSCRTSNRIKK